jgi:hypothetical protein
MPYSGPASAYAAIGKTEAAYFKMINDQGGINGRKINSFPTTIAPIRRRRSSRCAGWWNPTRCTWCSTSSEQRETQPFRSISTRRKFPISSYRAALHGLTIPSDTRGAWPGGQASKTKPASIRKLSKSIIPKRRSGSCITMMIPEKVTSPVSTKRLDQNHRKR